MIFYRLTKAVYGVLDGEGARLYGGRWNSPGRPMVYLGSSRSLCVLETIVHLDLPPELMPADYRLFSVEIPDASPLAPPSPAPADDAMCAATGDAFLVDGGFLGLFVPSVIIPRELNLLLNPLHPAMAGVFVIGSDPFAFDPRLLG